MKDSSGTGWVAIALAVVAYLFVRIYKRRSIRHIRGPPSPSFLLGHEYELNHRQVGELDFQWMREYGSTWRTGGAFGEDYLMTADAKALQHIYQKAGHNYAKKKDRVQISRTFFPGGITSTAGDVHKRQRKAMNPAFGPSHLRSFLPLFQRIGKKMCGRVNEELAGKSGATLLWNRWLSRTTLDIIGAASFDYDFGALGQDKTPLRTKYETVFTKIGFKLTKPSMVFRASWYYVPQAVLNFIRYLPFPPFDTLWDLNEDFEKIGKELLERNAHKAGGDQAGKDVITVLARANASEDPKTRLDDREVMAQLHTLTVAGHETTASTLSWFCYELAKHPEYQTKLREEIRSAREVVKARGGHDFTLEDLDGMKLALNAIKETMRFHPIVFNLYRDAINDDVIPLDDPITTTSGDRITEIPISAGQTIVTSFCGYHRLPHVWGKDADVWRPERFDEIDSSAQTRVGLVSNLMVFSSGHRGCIGWRFAMIEIQALVAELVETFEFTLPAEKMEPLRSAASALMIPILRGREHEGPLLPLNVAVAE